ncbi:MAG: FkbM family methyltransferase [Candidatus Parcubacteria bacterium]|nr:FkbM family methyltransferase [Candidatus Parcubacteria bacterium]
MNTRKDKRTLLIEALGSKDHQKRIRRARRFEQLGGGGVLKKIERVILTPGIYLPYVFYAKSGLGGDRLFTTTLFWGRAIQIPLRDYDSLGLHMFGFAGGNEAELKLTKYFSKHLGPDDIFYDIGANCGFYTYLASELCREVHTFEPISILARAIEMNSRGYAGVTVNCAAISNATGKMDFYIGEFSGLSTLNAAVVKGRSPASGTFKKTAVPTITLDDYTATHTKPTVLKIDAEGAERDIIEGGRHFFTENAPTVAMEVWGEKGGGRISMEAVEELRKLGYQSYRLDSEGAPQKVDGDLSDGMTPTGGENFIFKKDGENIYEF